MNTTSVGDIKKLDEVTINRIAAGEVVQRPSAAIKEMIENSLDAGATAISIICKNGGLDSLIIQDNGTGINKKDLPICCERFTTSKITSFDDLKSVSTYGFRGEALASITHVARVSIVTRTKKDPCAYRAKYCDGVLIPLKPGDKAEPRPCAGVVGTIITVEDMFYNMSTRRQAFKNYNEEYQRICDVVTKYAVKYGDNGVSFACKKQGSNTADVHTPLKSNTINNIKLLYGAQLAKELLAVDVNEYISISSDVPASESSSMHSVSVSSLTESNDHSSESLIETAISSENSKLNLDICQFQASGYISNANYSVKKPICILFINNRLVECYAIRKTIEAAYENILPKHTYPFIFISLVLPAHHVDVNVHPTKREVHFLHEDTLCAKLHEAVTKRLRGANESRVFYSQASLTQLPLFSTSQSSIANSKAKHSQESPSVQEDIPVALPTTDVPLDMVADAQHAENRLATPGVNAIVSVSPIASRVPASVSPPTCTNRVDVVSADADIASNLMGADTDPIEAPLLTDSDGVALSTNDLDALQGNCKGDEHGSIYTSEHHHASISALTGENTVVATPSDTLSRDVDKAQELVSRPVASKRTSKISNTNAPNSANKMVRVDYRSTKMKQYFPTVSNKRVDGGSRNTSVNSEGEQVMVEGVVETDTTEYRSLKGDEILKSNQSGEIVAVTEEKTEAVPQLCGECANPTSLKRKRSERMAINAKQSLSNTVTQGVSIDDIMAVDETSTEELIESPSISNMKSLSSKGMNSKRKHCDCCGSAFISARETNHASTSTALPNLPQIGYTSCEYTSIKELLSDFCGKEQVDPELEPILKQFIFVGMVNPQYCLIQYMTKLYMINIEVVGIQALYQLTIRQFGEFHYLEMEEKCNIYDMLRYCIAHLDNTEIEGEAVESHAENILLCLIKHRVMLFDYFNINIQLSDVKDIRECTVNGLPALLDAFFMPSPSKLPSFIYELGVSAMKTQWTEEKKCYLDIALVIAKYYMTSLQDMSPVSTNESFSDASDVNVDKLNDRMNNILLPLVRTYYRPTLKYHNFTHLTEIAALENLYKIFERC